MTNKAAALIAAFVLAAGATALAGSPPAKKLFGPIAGGLQKSAVTVLLPGNLPPEDGLRAELVSAGAKGYSIDLDFDPDCHQASACYDGSISGAPSPGGTPPGKPVKTSLGVTAYFVLGPCGASCSNSTLTFDYKGNRYVFEEKGGSLDSLSQWVKDVITLDAL